MTSTPRNKPNLTRYGTFDPTKGYVDFRLQQGVPVFDVDINDGSDYAGYQTKGLGIAALGIEGRPLGPYDWLPRPVTNDGVNPGVHNRNLDNFAVTLGRLATPMGVVDNSHFPLIQYGTRTGVGQAANKYKFVIYDWHLIENMGEELAQDWEYGNYMFRGVVSSVVDDTITDLTKRFTSNHRLIETDAVDLEVEGDTASGPSTGPEPQNTVNPWKVVFYEPACRVKFLSGVLAGTILDIIGFSETSLQLEISVSGSVAEGDEYIVLPGNALTQHALLYHAQTRAETLQFGGLTAAYWQSFYVMTWLEDICTDEDADLEHPKRSGDTTHRTQLRWCIRSANFRMSSEADEGYSTLHPVHIRKLLTLDGASPTDVGIGLYPHRDLLDDGAQPGVTDGDEGREFAQAWPVWVDGTGEVQTFLDSGLWGEQGLTRAHWFVNAVNEFGDRWNPEIFCSAIQAAMKSALTELTVNADPVFHSVLLTTVPSPKWSTVAEEDQYVWQYWHPAIPVALSDFVPRLECSGALIASLDADADAAPARVFAPAREFADSRHMAQELMQARSLGSNHPYLTDFFGPADSSIPGGLLYTSASGFDVPLLYSSLSEHLSAIDTLLCGVTGLGFGLGTTNGRARVTKYVIPSAKNFLFHEHTDTLAQAGQSNRSLTYSTLKQINPCEESQGAVTPIDVLVGSTNLNNSVDSNYGAFVAGPGEYRLREDGTTVGPEADYGWGHYRNPDLEAGAGTHTPIQRRPYEEGRAQAMQMAQALNFRKLAIKTSAHGEADLFDYWVGDPAALTEADGTLKNVGTPTGPGNSGVGAFQDATFRQDPTVVSPEDFNSYNGIETFNNVGSAPDEAYHAGEKGSQSVERAYVAEQAAVRIPTTVGPWGRWAKISTDQLDQWENRCTSFRLRYHIGDYYPGPVGDDGAAYTNALVDTLPLYVRFEPLSLVHWATMPKHMHSAIAKSFSFLDKLKAWLELVTGTGTTDHLMSGVIAEAHDTREVLTTETSPSHTEDGVPVGDPDPRNLPFRHDHHPFVHWYHPNMEHITAPWPSGDDHDYTEVGLDHPVCYHKFGERSLIIPALAYTGVGTGDADIHALENWEEADIAPTELGAHMPEANPGTEGIMVIDTQNVPVDGDSTPFPFVPGDPKDPDPDVTYAYMGYPGPVFMPSFRKFFEGVTGGDAHGFHPAFSAPGLDDSYGEKHFWPSIDADGYDDAGMSHYWDADGDREGGTFYFKTPVLRAAIRTDTVAAIVQLVRTLGSYSHDDAPAAPAEQPGAGPDVPTDTLFVGDLGTGVCLDSAGTIARSFFLNPMIMGSPASSVDGLPKHNSNTTDTYYDIFTYCADEREAASGTQPEFLPLLNTFVMMKYMGLQQKLLWNCSFRVLHARPGCANLNAPANGGVRTSAPKSLTEVFLVRDWETGAACNGGLGWAVQDGELVVPISPDSPAQKPFIHFESIHPVAAGGGGIPEHPNHPYLKHLYPMIADSLGAVEEGENGNLRESGAAIDTRLTANDFNSVSMILRTGLTGDTFVGDPFDYEYSHNQDPLSAVPYNDRLHQNSGIEIDLVSALRFIRENAATYHLDETGAFGKSLVQMMPTTEELTAPGDHEVIFVLYTGKYGQKMIDDTVPDGYNPPFAGCHIVASIEVNRPAERESSNTDTYGPGVLGKHYGEIPGRETYSILGKH